LTGSEGQHLAFSNYAIAAEQLFTVSARAKSPDDKLKSLIGPNGHNKKGRHFHGGLFLFRLRLKANR
jgi:hypothetical protein